MSKLRFVSSGLIIPVLLAQRARARWGEQDWAALALVAEVEKPATSNSKLRKRPAMPATACSIQALEHPMPDYARLRDQAQASSR